MKSRGMIYRTIPYLMLLSIAAIMLGSRFEKGWVNVSGLRQRYTLDMGNHLESLPTEQGLSSLDSDVVNIDGTKCPLKPLSDNDQYYNFIRSPTAYCNKVPVGNYYVCLDNITKNDCLVYSFGIGNIWDFDDGIVKQKGCQVHSFDPTMGVDDHKRGTNIQFHNLGVSNFKGTKIMSYIGKKNITCKVNTLGGIIQMLNHTDATIDILKLDIEGSELDVILDMAINYPEVFSRVKQLIMEIHNLEEFNWIYWHTGNSWKTSIPDYWKMLQILNCYGFRMMYSIKIGQWGNMFTFKDKQNNKTRSCCYETTWIKSDFM